MAKDSNDDGAKKDDTQDSSQDSPTKDTGENNHGKRKDRDDNVAENEEEGAKKQKADEGEEEAKGGEEEKEAPAAADTAEGAAKAGNSSKPSDEATKSPAQPSTEQQQAAMAASLGNPLFAAGMPLSAVAGLDPSSPQAALFMAQQGQLPFGAAGFPMGNPAIQNRFLQGLVANPPAGTNQQSQGQQGQDAKANVPAAAPGVPPQGMAAFPADTLSQLYAQQGIGPTHMMMMGMNPGFAAGNPFMGGAMRPFMGGIADAPLAGLSGGLYRSPSIPLGLPCDDEHLSEYQILVRQQLELFEAEQEDVDSNTQGRKKAVTLGQVGIRCRHCAGLTLRQRGKGSVYYPTKLTGIYQAAQNMASSHLTDACQCIDERLKMSLMSLRQRRDTASGGKQYWADGAKAVGLYETEDGLRLNRTPQMAAQQAAQTSQTQQSFAA